MEVAPGQRSGQACQALRRQAVPAASCCQILCPAGLPLRMRGQTGSPGARGFFLVPEQSTQNKKFWFCYLPVVGLWVSYKFSAEFCVMKQCHQPHRQPWGRRWPTAGGPELPPFLLFGCLGEGRARDLSAERQDAALPEALQVAGPGRFQNSSFAAKRSIPGGCFPAG